MPRKKTAITTWAQGVVGSNPIAPTNISMSCARRNHSGIKSQAHHLGSCLFHLICHHVPVEVKCGLDVRVAHEFLLYGDGSPHSIEPRAVRMSHAVRPELADPRGSGRIP